jgi:predicted nucleic acid-binding protein
MILTDSSILIRQIRTPDPRVMSLIIGYSAAVCGVTILEVLAGARTPQHRASAAAMLSAFQRVPTPESVWELAGQNQARLAANGLTVPLPDTLIATIALDAGLELWTYDAHFAAMGTLLSGLRLFHEPP